MSLILILFIVYSLCFTYSNSQVFDVISIPLTPGAYIEASNFPYTARNFSMKTGNIQLVLTSCGIKLLYKGETVWSPYNFDSNKSDPVISFNIKDGDLCLRNNPKSTISTWCTYYFGLGAKYLNILPEGSYGRQWAIVTQDIHGKMVWGRFGPAINTRGILPLIPGNFISSISISNVISSQNGRQCINNGKDYLCVGSRLPDSLSFYVPLKASNFATEPQWKVANSVSGKVSRVLFGSDTNLCVTDINGSPIWCNGYVHMKQRYLVIPIASDYDNYSHHGAWVTLDDDMKLVSGKILFFQQEVNNSFPLNGLSNDYVNITFNTISGEVNHYSKLENSKLIKSSISNDSLISGTYGSGFLGQGISRGYFFYKKPMLSYATCNFMNHECYSSIEKYIQLRRPVDHSYWYSKKQVKWFGISRYLPEVLLLDSDGMIVSSSETLIDLIMDIQSAINQIHNKLHKI